MKALVLAGLAASTLVLGSLSPASAEGGCGPFRHRGFNGFCYPNARPYPVYGYGWHRPYGYGWHRGYGWHGPYGYRRPW
jgi:hypothetical protein